MRTADGKLVEFVAQPDEAVNRDNGVVYARPDDVGEDGLTWRQKLVEYNGSSAKSGQSGLLPAYQLYKPGIYRRLVDVFGPDNVYILSAGWGLVRASFKLPKYDITFSSSADRCKKRGKRDEYADFNQLDEDSDEALLFFGGNDYLSLFCEMTESWRGRRVVYFRSRKEPEYPGVEFVRFESLASTNWHYGCASRCANLFAADPTAFDPVTVTS